MTSQLQRIEKQSALVSPIEQVSRDITEGRALSFLRCLCLTRPCNESGFRSPRCHPHYTGMNGVSQSRHSFFIFFS